MVLHWLSNLHADAMSQTWSYTDTSRNRCMSQTCLSLVYISRPMHVPDMSYTSTNLNANAVSQTWSYTSIQMTQMSWHEYLICS
ncbi:putative diguanylate cyclase YeaP [Gossypium arboreum]|uniref:Putative diguanylate cyclase YeaP n=1 Tax=Gossypium arboreum TaxID=29729 RepID=A0A0B0MSQ8_GOSAR|nr:putative diguanylate cyclase YeaP [Gossypium arboreum]